MKKRYVLHIEINDDPTLYQYTVLLKEGEVTVQEYSGERLRTLMHQAYEYITRAEGE